MEDQPQPLPKKRGRKPKPKDEKKDDPKAFATSPGTKRPSSALSRQHAVDDKYSQWKTLVPVLYDWLANHNLVWPTLSCRALPVYFRLLFYLATALLLCGGSFLQKGNIVLPNPNEQIKLGTLSPSPAAAVSCISWIFSPDNSRVQEIVSNFLIKSAESWKVKQFAPSLPDGGVSSYVKMPKKPKYRHHKSTVDYQSTALWLKEFQK